MEQPLIEAKALSKSWGARKALSDVSFNVYAEEVLCLLGPNGAGKSTAINILTTALVPDQGEVRFQGVTVQGDTRRYKEHLGIVPQDLAIYEEISAAANVKFYASLYGLRGKELQRRVAEALEFVQLTERQHERPQTFSGGMKRRLNIACAIAHRPRVIMMDEPTVGIDPQSRNHILESIRQLRASGATIIYTTHYMEEVEAISTRIIIMDHGRIIATGTKEELKERLAGGRFYTIEADGMESLPTDALYQITGIKQVNVRMNRIEIVALQGIENLDQIISVLLAHGVRIRNLITASTSLETVFLQLTGRTLRD